ncbi:Thioredoxin-like protein [Phaffia rhodozyma]|uniref:Thioredoxin n=1 Tax=Phaffia rhodozyma TaxID=264483 RepID=A0A0F7SQ20_PHARH|nr:Thioredoxin-like protein [Phaffia rhodozyma]
MATDVLKLWPASSFCGSHYSAVSKIDITCGSSKKIKINTTMPYIEIKELQQFNRVLSETSAEKLVVIDFHATWCGPCRAIAPVYERLSNSVLHATFLKVDTDKVPAIAQKYNIRAMPTFVFLKGGNKIDELKGADPTGLTEKVNRLAGPPPSSFASGSKSSSKSLTEGLTSLKPVIDSRELQCLNEVDDHTLKGILGSDAKEGNFLESDADEQLLITIPFLQPTRLRALVIRTDPSKLELAPKRLKLFINHPSLGFPEAETFAPTQEFELTSKQVEEAEGTVRLDLRLVRFQGVGSLSIFVVSNMGGDEVTRIDGIDLFGEVMEGGSKGPLQKVED